MTLTSPRGDKLGRAVEPSFAPPGTSGRRIGKHATAAPKHPRAHAVLDLRNTAGIFQPGAPRVVVYEFELTKHGFLGSHVILAFSLRYTAALSLHRKLARSGGMLEQLGLQQLRDAFPPPYHMRNMLSIENRAMRAEQLLGYFRELLLSKPSVWLDPDLCAGLQVKSSIASVLWVVVHQRNDPGSDPELDPEPEPEHETLLRDLPTTGKVGQGLTVTSQRSGMATRDIPGHFAGWWCNDARSEDWDPMLKAMDLSWVVRQIGRNLNPDIEIFFTETHYNVYGKTLLGANTDSFPLSGEEEIRLLAVPGQRNKGKFSYKYWSDGQIVRTWTYQWTADHQQRRWLTLSERRLERKNSNSTLDTGAGDAAAAPGLSFNETVRFEQLDKPAAAVVLTNRYMTRDVSVVGGGRRPVRAFPPALEARRWGGESALKSAGGASENKDTQPAGAKTTGRRTDSGAGTRGSSCSAADNDGRAWRRGVSPAGVTLHIPANDVEVVGAVPAPAPPPQQSNLLQRFVEQLFNPGVPVDAGAQSIHPRNVSVLGGPFSYGPADNATDGSDYASHHSRRSQPTERQRAAAAEAVGYTGYQDMRSEVERMIDASGGESYESVGELLQVMWAQRGTLMNRYGGLCVLVVMVLAWLANQALHSLLFGFEPTPEYRSV